MRGLLTAIRFLTVVPVGGAHLREGDMGRASGWFPVVGLLVGMVLAGIDWYGRAVWDANVGAALVIAGGIILTGGLHIDGLMDTADAFFSGAGRERMLEIMRDARSGALGVAAGACLLLAKFAAYGQLEGPSHWRAIAAAPAVGRMGIVVGVAAFRYARAAGTGARFAAEVGKRHMLGAMVLCAAMCVGLLGWIGLGVFGLGAALAVAGGAYASRKLGGMTGDVYGAVNEVVELAALLAGGVVLRRLM